MSDRLDPKVRQQVLQLWLASAALDTTVSAWAFYDGTDGRGPALPEAEPPYRTGVDALRDGWCVLQAPGPVPLDQTPGELPAEYLLERRVRVD